MKKKILSLLMSFCFVVISLFSLIGCSVVSEDTTKINKKEVMRIGNVELTKGDVINSFYTYYQNNSNYFSYYDEETILNSFYTWAIMKEIVNQKAEENLYHPEDNQDGYLVYTKEDDEDVVKATFAYIYSQVSAYEKAIYELNDEIDPEEYPSWLQEETEEEEESSKEFEFYESKIPEIKIRSKADYAPKLTDEEVKNRAEDLMKYVFEYVSEKAESEEEEDVRSNINGDELIVRNKAWAKYVEGLVSNAKSAGKQIDEEELLLEELVRVYNAYYDSQLTSILQQYYVNNKLLDTVNGDTESLSDKAVVKAYLEAYFTDVQLYQVEDAYVAKMTNKDGASLVLYNYDGQNYFFTVQHILVAYDTYMTDKIKEIDGYSASGDYDTVIHENFMKERNELTDDYSMYTKINKDSVEKFEDSITPVGRYYYYDKNLAGDASKNYGYVELTISLEGDKTVYKKNGTQEKVDEADVQYLASEDDILECYDTTLSNWMNWCSQYIAYNDNEQGRKDFVKSHESMEYVFKVAQNIYDNGKAKGLQTSEINEQIKQKIASLLFVELQWIYSTDSLGNELSNKMGYVISNYPDQNGSWVVDFAVGARDIVASLVDGDTSEVDMTNVITSNYGYHIIKIENIFKSGGSLVDMSGLTNIDINDSEFVSEMAARLKNTYLCTSSNQTLYDYYKDTIYTELAGSSESSGTYFMAIQYEWLAEYNKEKDIEYYTKLGYDELMDAIA